MDADPAWQREFEDTQAALRALRETGTDSTEAPPMPERLRAGIWEGIQNRVPGAGRDLDCVAASGMIPTFDELSADQSRALEHHLEGCETCRASSVQFSAQRDMLRAYGDAVAGRPVPAAVRTRIQEGVAAALPAPAGRLAPVLRLSQWARGPAVAALIILGLGLSLLLLPDPGTAPPTTPGADAPEIDSPVEPIDVAPQPLVPDEVAGPAPLPEPVPVPMPAVRAVQVRNPVALTRQVDPEGHATLMPTRPAREVKQPYLAPSTAGERAGQRGTGFGLPRARVITDERELRIGY